MSIGGVGGEHVKVCDLVIVGVTARINEQFLVMEDGLHEATQS